MARRQLTFVVCAKKLRRKRSEANPCVFGDNVLLADEVGESRSCVVRRASIVVA